MKTLNVDLVHTMVNNYRENQLAIINKHPDSKTNNDAHSIWFDLESLKNFVSEIETTVKNVDGSVVPERLGVRIYYAAYPDKSSFGKFDDLEELLNDAETEKYENLHTLVMIPTITIDNDAIDFNPLDKNTYEKGLVDLEEYKLNSTSEIPGSIPALARNIGAKNHGSLIPPGRLTAEGF